MSDQLNEQTEKMREMAQTTLDKAKDAVSKYMAESQKMREKVDSSVQASYSSAKEMNQKAVAFAEANVVAGFELAQRLLASLPAAVRGAQVDLENNFRAVLRSTLGKMDLVTRDEFDVQTKVLERTRARLAVLEARLVQLEQAGGSPTGSA